MRTAFPIPASHSGEENAFQRYKVNRLFPSCRGMRGNEYIVTGLSSAPYYESRIKLSLGYTDLTNHGLKIVECSEYQIDEICRAPLPSLAYQTEWVPLHPQLLAVASNDIRFYEYENRNLTLKESFLEEFCNPVISLDWNRRQPEKMLITRKNGAVAILFLEYGASIELTGNMSTHQYLFRPVCGARFGTGEMENCIFVTDDDNLTKVFDHQLFSINIYVPWDEKAILNMECSKHNDYLIATLTEKEVCLYDVRYLRDAEVASFNSFHDEERATCLCWSPDSTVIYIGTTCGAVIRWKTDDNKTTDRFYNYNKKISSIHCPEEKSNLLLSTCFDSHTDPYASTIEKYSMQLF